MLDEYGKEEENEFGHLCLYKDVKDFISVDRAITDDEAVEITTGTKKLTLWAKVKNWFSKLKEVKR